MEEPKMKAEILLAQYSSVFISAPYDDKLIDDILQITGVQGLDDVQQYTELFVSYGLRNLVTLSTYVPPNSESGSSCLDHIWSNLTDFGKCFVLYPQISDHSPVAVVFNTLVENVSKTEKYRDYSIAPRR